MSKLILGKRPKSFKKTVEFPMHDGTTGKIEMTYKYRTRREFAEMTDARVAKVAEEQEEKAVAAAKLSAAGAAEAATDVQTSAPSTAGFYSTLADATIESNARYILDIAEGWSLPEAFEYETLCQLADELPAAVNAILAGYGGAIQEGRLGN